MKDEEWGDGSEKIRGMVKQIEDHESAIGMTYHGGGVIIALRKEICLAVSSGENGTENTATTVLLTMPAEVAMAVSDSIMRLVADHEPAVAVKFLAASMESMQFEKSGKVCGNA